MVKVIFVGHVVVILRTVTNYTLVIIGQQVLVTTRV